MNAASAAASTSCSAFQLEFKDNDPPRQQVVPGLLSGISQATDRSASIFRNLFGLTNRSEAPRVSAHGRSLSASFTPVSIFPEHEARANSKSEAVHVVIEPQKTSPARRRSSIDVQEFRDKITLLKKGELTTQNFDTWIRSYPSSVFTELVSTESELIVKTLSHETLVEAIRYSLAQDVKQTEDFSSALQSQAFGVALATAILRYKLQTNKIPIDKSMKETDVLDAFTRACQEKKNDPLVQELFLTIAIASYALQEKEKRLKGDKQTIQQPLGFALHLIIFRVLRPDAGLKNPKGTSEALKLANCYWLQGKEQGREQTLSLKNLANAVMTPEVLTPLFATFSDNKVFEAIQGEIAALEARVARCKEMIDTIPHLVLAFDGNNSDIAALEKDHLQALTELLTKHWKTISSSPTKPLEAALYLLLLQKEQNANQCLGNLNFNDIFKHFLDQGATKQEIEAAIKAREIDWKSTIGEDKYKTALSLLK